MHIYNTSLHWIQSQFQLSFAFQLTETKFGFMISSCQDDWWWLSWSQCFLELQMAAAVKENTVDPVVEACCLLNLTNSTLTSCPALLVFCEPQVPGSNRMWGDPLLLGYISWGAQSTNAKTFESRSAPRTAMGSLTWPRVSQYDLFAMCRPPLKFRLQFLFYNRISAVFAPGFY